MYWLISIYIVLTLIFLIINKPILVTVSVLIFPLLIWYLNQVNLNSNNSNQSNSTVVNSNQNKLNSDSSNQNNSTVVNSDHNKLNSNTSVIINSDQSKLSNLSIYEEFVYLKNKNKSLFTPKIISSTSTELESFGDILINCNFINLSLYIYDSDSNGKYIISNFKYEDNKEINTNLIIKNSDGTLIKNCVLYKNILTIHDFDIKEPSIIWVVICINNKFNKDNKDILSISENSYCSCEDIYTNELDEDTCDWPQLPCRHPNFQNYDSEDNSFDEIYKNKN